MTDSKSNRQADIRSYCQTKIMSAPPAHETRMMCTPATFDDLPDEIRSKIMMMRALNHAKTLLWRKVPVWNCIAANKRDLVFMLIGTPCKKRFPTKSVLRQQLCERHIRKYVEYERRCEMVWNPVEGAWGKSEQHWKSLCLELERQYTSFWNHCTDRGCLDREFQRYKREYIADFPHPWMYP